MTDIYLNIVARMTDYMATHPYEYRSDDAAGATRRELAFVPGTGNTTHYHSLLAAPPRFRFREFITFHEQYTMPEYLIAYQRSSSDDV